MAAAMTKTVAPLKMANGGPPPAKKIKRATLGDLNEHIICRLCGGYFIDPVTIVECLHSFCKTCIVRHVAVSKQCPSCDGQIHKTKPLLSMRMDKTLQDIVFKLVPGLYHDEKERRKKFQEQHQPEKPFKAEEGERIFFSLDDKISMSIEYYDPDSTDRKSGSMALLNASTPANGIKAAAAAKENNNTKGNPNKRYLECPGSVKVQSLKKFIAMKYGLSEEFVVDVIYRNDLIPEDYSLVDIAYAYNWRKDVPMQFFYRIFKKTKVLLKRKKRKVKSSESVQDGSKSEAATGKAGESKANGTPPVKKLKMTLAPPPPPSPSVKAAEPVNKVSFKKSPTSKSLTAVLAKTKTTSERFDGLFSTPATKPASPPKSDNNTSDGKLNFVTEKTDKKEDRKIPEVSTVKHTPLPAVKTSVGSTAVAKPPPVSKTSASVPKAPVVKPVKLSAPSVIKTSVPSVNKTSVPSVNKTSVPSVNKASVPTLKTSVAVVKTTVPAVAKPTNPLVSKPIAPGVKPITTLKASDTISKSSVQPKSSVVMSQKQVQKPSAVPMADAVTKPSPAQQKPIVKGAHPTLKIAPVSPPKLGDKSKSEEEKKKQPKLEQGKTLSPSSEPKKEFKDAIGSIVREITKRDVDNAIKADSPKLEAADIKVNIVTKAEAATEKKAEHKKVEQKSGHLSTIVNNLAKKQESKADAKPEKQQLTKSIPSGTTITVKQVPVAGSSPQTAAAAADPSKEKKLTSTESTSIGNTSLKNFVNNQHKTVTTSDLRQFRKPAPTSTTNSSPSATKVTAPLKPTTIPITSQTKLAAAQAAAVKKVTTPQQQQPQPAKTSLVKPIAAKASPASPKTTAPMVPTTSAFALGATQQALIAAQCITAAANGRAPLSMESLPHFAAAQAAALSQAAAAAVVEQQKAAMQNMFRLPLGQGRPTPAVTTSSGFTSTPPSNRLQLKVKTTSPPSTMPVTTLPSLYSHMAADTIWKYQAAGMAAAMAAAGVPVTTAGGGLAPKANQGLRHIPNPSLLSKQNSSATSPKSPKAGSSAKAAAAAAEDAKQKLLQQQSLILQQMAAATTAAAATSTP